MDDQTDPKNCGKCGHACTGATPACSNGVCVSQCQGAPDGTGCNDGNPCTPEEVCKAGACIPANAFVPQTQPPTQPNLLASPMATNWFSYAATEPDGSDGYGGYASYVWTEGGTLYGQQTSLGPVNTCAQGCLAGMQCDATLQSCVAAVDGTGSWLLASEGASIEYAGYIPVTPGQRYTFSISVQSEAAPAYLALNYRVATATGTHNYYNWLYATAQPNVREKMVGVYTAGWNDVAISPTIMRFAGPFNAGTTQTSSTCAPGLFNTPGNYPVCQEAFLAGNVKLWVSDAYFGVATALPTPTMAKDSFDGTYTKLDPLGNWCVNWPASSSPTGAAGWQPFYPFCMYEGGTYAPSTYLSAFGQQGFNCMMEAEYPSDLTGPNAMPRGMKTMLGISGWLGNADSRYQDGEFEAFVKAVAADPNRSDTLAYCWDDEAYNARSGKAIQAELDSFDHDPGSINKREFPMTVLQGNFGVASTFAGEGIGDSVMEYQTEWGQVWPGSEEAWATLWTQPGQSKPLGIGVVSGIYDSADFLGKAYQLLIAGAKGVAIYAANDPQSCSPPDGSVCPAPWARPVWRDCTLHNFRQQLDWLAPILRQAPWTPWSATSSDPAVMIGKRDLFGRSFLMLANRATGARSTTVSLAGLPYAPTQATDYLALNPASPAPAGTCHGPTPNGSAPPPVAPFTPSNTDCQSGFLGIGGLCQATPAAACSDGVRDGNETGTDCGGICAACPSAPPPPKPCVVNPGVTGSSASFQLGPLATCVFRLDP